jgi:hypothetical protein
MEFTNEGATKLLLYGVGSRYLHEPPSFFPDGSRTLVQHVPFGFDGSALYKLISAKYPRLALPIPFEVYVKNERGEDVVVNCNFVATWKNGVLNLGASNVSSTTEQWSREFPQPK